MDINTDAFEVLQDLLSGNSHEIQELTAEQFSLFLAYGSLDRDVELN